LTGAQTLVWQSRSPNFSLAGVQTTQKFRGVKLVVFSLATPWNPSEGSTRECLAVPSR